MMRTFVVLVFLMAAPSVRAADEVVYHDRIGGNAHAKLQGVIQDESLRGITLRIGKEERTIAATDIVEVDYQPPGNVTRIEFHRPFNRENDALKATTDEERKSLLAEAVRAYRALLPRLTERSYAQRYVQFRLAQIVARQAELDRALEEEAVAALARFQAQYPDSWEVVACTRSLARLRENRKDWAGAQKTYEDLAAQRNLPPELRRECELAVVQYLLRRQQHAQAEKRIQDLMRGLPADDPLLPRLQVRSAECQIAAGKLTEAEPVLRRLLRGAAEPGVKALACNTLAEGYERARQPEEALWQYLWVDVVYNQDPDEHARALYHLARLFEQVKKDPQRAQQCRERLLKDPEFAGREYQVLAAGAKE